jgi:hypothetical protein
MILDFYFSNYNRFFLSLSFFGLQRFFDNYFNNNKLGINFSAMTHAFLSVLLSGTFIISDNFNLLSSSNLLLLDNTVRNVSSGYFIYDIVYTLLRQKGVLKYAYLYHHFSSLFLLKQNANIFPVHQILFFAELSNLPSYMVYYYIQKLKKNNGLFKEYLINQKKLKYWKNIQNYLYSFIRIPVLAYFTGNFFINNYKNKENLKKGIILFPVYLMGLYWSYKIVSDKKKNKKTEN